MFDILTLLDTVLIDKPVNIGDIVVENVLNTGVDIVATKRIE